MNIRSLDLTKTPSIHWGWIRILMYTMGCILDVIGGISVGWIIWMGTLRDIRLLAGVDRIRDTCEYILPCLLGCFLGV